MKDFEFLNEAVKESLLSIDPINDKKVGCVIVKDNVIVGRGHRFVTIVKKYPHMDICIHAEHMALAEAGDDAKGATMYCTLEPCTARVKKYSKAFTPDNCCDHIIKHSVAKVFYLESDLGHGALGEKRLLDAGIKVKKIVI